MDNNELEKRQILGAKGLKNIADVLEEVEILIDTHFFNEFCETKSSLFLKRALENQKYIDMPPPQEDIEDIELYSQDNESYPGDPREPPLHRQEKKLVTKKTETTCFCIQTGMPLSDKHITTCCRKVSGEINARHNIVVNILLNNVLIQRGLITYEQKWEERKMV